MSFASWDFIILMGTIFVALFVCIVAVVMLAKVNRTMNKIAQANVKHIGRPRKVKEVEEPAEATKSAPVGKPGDFVQVGKA